jgi:hypothetical protein
MRLSDETETMAGLARVADPAGAAGDTGDTESAGRAGGCLAIMGYEGAPAEVEQRRDGARAVLAAAGGEHLGAEPGESWAHGRFGAPYLRDALLDIGAFAETLETAAFWSGLPELHRAVREALTGAAWLYVRGGGDDNAYRRVALTRDGDAYLRATIPAELVKGDHVAWFVEIGEGGLGLASRESPREIRVEEETAEPPPAPGRTSITSSIDYVDFDGGLAKGFDQYYQAELDFTYRFLSPVHAMRIGFGTLSGKGGPKDVIDDDPLDQCRDAGGSYQCRAVDYTYVYTEVELHPTRFISLMLRPQAGLLTTDRMEGEGGSPTRCRDTDEIGQCDFLTRVGFRARARFGDERSTNLIVGLGVTDGVGTLFEAIYHWAPRLDVPVNLAVQVTDLPVTTDFGVRLLADVGYRGRSWVYPSLRLSYQARDIDHAGFSGGLGLNFDW